MIKIIKQLNKQVVTLWLNTYFYLFTRLKN